MAWTAVTSSSAAPGRSTTSIATSSNRSPTSSPWAAVKAGDSVEIVARSRSVASVCGVRSTPTTRSSIVGPSGLPKTLSSPDWARSIWAGE